MWFCQHGKNNRKTKWTFFWLRTDSSWLVLEWCHSSTKAGFNYHHSILQMCVCNMCLCVVYICRNGTRKSEIQDLLPYFLHSWPQISFLSDSFSSLKPHSLLPTLTLCNLFTLDSSPCVSSIRNIAWHCLRSFELDWLAQRSLANISHSPSTSTPFLIACSFQKGLFW